MTSNTQLGLLVRGKNFEFQSLDAQTNPYLFNVHVHSSQFKILRPALQLAGNQHASVRPTCSLSCLFADNLPFVRDSSGFTNKHNHKHLTIITIKSGINEIFLHHRLDLD